MNAQYVRRVDAGRPETGMDFDRRGDSLDKARPSMTSSVTSSTMAFSEESGDKFIKILKPDASEVPAPQASRPKFIKWPGSKSQAPKDVHATNELIKGKARVEHTFQQTSMLRVSRCDHCGDKMWGSQLRCSGKQFYTTSGSDFQYLYIRVQYCSTYAVCPPGHSAMFSAN